MGAESSALRAGGSQEDGPVPVPVPVPASASGELRAEAQQEGGRVPDFKALQKNGQVSSMTSLNGHLEDDSLAEVGQPDGVSVAQKEEASENVDAIQDEVAPQVNEEKESPDAGDISAAEEKATEEKPDETNEVGFKKIFRFVGFKFTLKKDKGEEKDPVKLLTVKDKEGEEVSKTDEPTEEAEVATTEENGTAEEKEADTEVPAAKAEVIENGAETEVTDEIVKEEEAEKEAETTQPAQETTMSSFRKLFNGGLFSNLRKKASIKKTKDEEDKEATAEEEASKTEETVATVEEKDEEVEQETKEAAPATPVEEQSESKEEVTQEVAKSEAIAEPEVAVETPAAEDSKQEEEKVEAAVEEEKAAAAVMSEPELLSSQEKAKPLGSPLKKLFTGAGLKKLSTKKQKTKKETESKLTESGEQAAEQLQSSTESAETPKAESGPSSPEDSGEHVIAVAVTQSDSAQETDGEVASDGEKKKEGIIAWSSFKKLVTPKKRVKRSSESEDEATGEKSAKSATLSSSESAALADKSVEEETKEDKPTEEEPKTENTEKLVSSTEEPKKKMDTSVSWEALMCMGGPKKRTRKTSDSDDEETKIEEELQASAEGEKVGKTEAAIVASQNVECEGEATTPEPVSSQEKESAWDTLKRMVMPKNKAKVEEKPEESAEQVQSDSEAPKDESSFSLKKFLPGRRKKKSDKQASTEQGSGEEDSDTPAVVPLSEYNDQPEVEQGATAESVAEVVTEPVAEPAAEVVTAPAAESAAEPAAEVVTAPAAESAAEPAAEVVTEPAIVQTKVSSEERSPSWIAAVAEDADEKRDELSDITEEAESAATPKSVDTDTAEDEAQSESPCATQRRLSTAEVKPIDQAPAAETTPIPQGPDPESVEVIGDMEVQVCEIATTTSITIEDVPTEYQQPAEQVETNVNNAVLEPNACEEAAMICTGLVTKEIAEVAMEEHVTATVECVDVVCDVLSTVVSNAEQLPNLEEAVVTEEAAPLVMAQRNQGETVTLEPAVENSAAEGGIQEASESHEADIEMSIVNTREENEIIIPEVLPSEEVPVIAETVVLVAPECAPECDNEAPSDVATVSEAVDDEQVQTQETNETGSALETVEAAELPTGDSEISAVIEEASEKMDEIQGEVQQESEIEAQSVVITQAVIQDAMDKVSDDAPEPETATNPADAVPASFQAVATTEKEMELSAENQVIIEPAVMVACEKSPEPLCVTMEVIDTIPVEVIAGLDASVEGEESREEGLKEAVEVEVSEETVVFEEVVEIKEESETGEELNKVEIKEESETGEEEPSKVEADIQEPDVEGAAEEVKPEPEAAKPETPSVEEEEEEAPVQVVLQTAQVVEEPSVDEEAAVEFVGFGAAAEEADGVKGEGKNEDSAPSEECPATTPAEDSAPGEVTTAASSQSEAEKTSSIKCAEVMAQVIEVIEEAVKEIEPQSTEITTAS